MNHDTVMSFFNYEDAYALEVSYIDSFTRSAVLVTDCDCYKDDLTKLRFCREQEFIFTFAVEPYLDGVMYIPIMIPSHLRNSIEKGDLQPFRKQKITMDIINYPEGQDMMVMYPKVFTPKQ